MNCYRSLLTRPSLIAAATAALLVPAIAGCGANTSADEQVLVVSTWGGIYNDFFAQSVEPVFHEEYPNVEVIYDEGGMSARYNKLLSQGPSSTIELFASTGEFQYAATEEDLLAKIDRSSVPNAQELHEWAQPTAEGYAPAWGGVTVGLTYNPEYFDGTPPTSWNDLWDEDVQSQIVVPAVEHAVMPAFLAAVTEAFNGGKAATYQGAETSLDVQPGLDALASLDPATSTLFYTDWHSRYTSGEVVLAVEYDMYVDLMRREGANMEFVVPEEGALGQALYLDITAAVTDDKKEIAEAFLNAALSEGAQRGIATGPFRGAPSRVGIELPEDVANVITLYSDPDNVSFFPDPVARNVRPEWTNLWNSKVAPSWGE